MQLEQLEQGQIFSSDVLFNIELYNFFYNSIFKSNKKLIIRIIIINSTKYLHKMPNQGKSLMNNKDSVLEENEKQEIFLE